MLQQIIQLFALCARGSDVRKALDAVPTLKGITTDISEYNHISVVPVLKNFDIDKAKF
jgi:hypothetical protein